MNTLPPTDAPLAPPPSGSGHAVPPQDGLGHRDQVQQRITHLFRYSLRGGHINPLMHLVTEYRMGQLP